MMEDFTNPVCCQSSYCGRLECSGCPNVMPIIACYLKATNNGKLLRARLPRHLRDQVPALIASGHLVPDRFMEARDSIRLGPNAG